MNINSIPKRKECRTSFHSPKCKQTESELINRVNCKTNVNTVQRPKTYHSGMKYVNVEYFVVCIFRKWAGFVVFEMKRTNTTTQFYWKEEYNSFWLFFFSFHSTLLYTYIIHISSWASYREHVRICNNTFSKSHKLKAKTFEKKKHFRFADHRKCVRVFFRRHSILLFHTFVCDVCVCLEMEEAERKKKCWNSSNYLCHMIPLLAGCTS